MRYIKWKEKTNVYFIQNISFIHSSANQYLFQKYSNIYWKMQAIQLMIGQVIRRFYFIFHSVLECGTQYVLSAWFLYDPRSPKTKWFWNAKYQQKCQIISNMRFFAVDLTFSIRSMLCFCYHSMSYSLICWNKTFSKCMHL